MQKKLCGEYLSQLVGEYIEECLLENLSPQTIRNIRQSCRLFLGYLEGKEMSLEELKAYRKDLLGRVSLRTTRCYLSFLKMFCQWLYEEKRVIDEDWARLLRNPRNTGKYEAEPEVLPSPQRMLELINLVTTPGPGDNSRNVTAKLEYREYFHFLCKTGMRPKEAQNIKPQHIVLDDAYPHVKVVRKGGKWRQIGLVREPEFLASIRQRTMNKRLFSVNQSQCEEYCQRMSAIAGLRVTQYTMRKINDTKLIENGANPLIAANHQGHTLKVMQEHYLKYSAKESSDVINTFGPFTDRAKLPAVYTIEHIERFAERIHQHPAFRVEKNENSLTIRW